MWEDPLPGYGNYNNQYSKQLLESMIDAKYKGAWVIIIISK